MPIGLSFKFNLACKKRRPSDDFLCSSIIILLLLFLDFTHDASPQLFSFCKKYQHPTISCTIEYFNGLKHSINDNCSKVLHSY